MAGGEEKSVRVVCNSCERRTNHRVLKEYANRTSDEAAEVDWWETSRILGCMGCDTVCFHQASWSSDDYDPETGELHVAETLYPSPATGRAAMPERYLLPEKVRHIYEDLLKVFNQDARLLSALGLRTLVEAICIDQSCPGKDLKAKINGLVGKGTLAEKQADFLHLHRFLGNDAAHEIEAPHVDELTAGLDIIEALLRTVYGLPELAAEMEARRKKRQAKKAAAGKQTAATATAAPKAAPAPVSPAPTPPAAGAASAPPDPVA